MSDNLQHYGVKRRSGRYPWGSGKDPQRSQDILNAIDERRAKGMNDTAIAKDLGLTTTQLRNEITWANQMRKQATMDSVVSMKERGMTNTQIAEKLVMSESSVRNYISNKDSVTLNQLDNIADTLKNRIDDVEYLDVGVGVERQMGISRTKLKAAVAKLKEEGYVEHEIYIKRLNDPSKYTTIKVLTKEKDLEIVKQNSDKIRPIESWTDDGGLTMQNMKPIQHIDWDRVHIRYDEDGGTAKDGVIEMRRNKSDLDLGDSKYAQVRIGVGGSHYLKGMAMYADDIPAGKDIVFNTNKKKGTPKEDVLKKLKDNPDNPFGATITRQNKALNIVNEEGDWNKWSSTLSSQFLSKQSNRLVKERLDETFKKVKNEYSEIMGLTNPIVKKHLLESYINEVDSKSKHLKAVGLPRTKSHVILPFPGMKPNEVYAPNYKDGEKVVLVRYPHGGIFELPELTVNNKGPARKTLGNALDAIGIHPSVANKLSGADFDGDTVYVIPNNKKKIKTSRSLQELKNFDPNSYHVDYKTISPAYKQKQMGIVSNLITDMTIKGATQSELARAVKHSMVVIDSEKHQLDYKKSAVDNGISALQKKYQTHVNPVTGKVSKGASTLISKKKQVLDIGGEKVKFVDEKTGKVKTKLVGAEKVHIMDYFPNAHKLSSGSSVENLYANYINDLKVVKNTATKNYMSIKPLQRNKESAKKYSKEVDSLKYKLNTALSNAPKERQAQLLASNTYYKNLTYDMDKDQKKKLKSQSLAGARSKVGAKRTLVDITDNEWEAIQSGAISNNMLEQILRNSDMDKVKKLATPKPKKTMSSAKIARVKAMLSNNYTYAEIADALGVSVSTIRNEVIK